MSTPIKVISSMAVAGLLKELCPTVSQAASLAVHPESIGGVDATRRVRAAENFDILIMADRLIDQLIDEGHIRAGTRVDLARSFAAIAVAKKATVPDVSTEEKLKDAMLNARSIGYSTGPSGVAIVQMVQRWGLFEQLKARMIESKPGVLVGSLIARGEVELGFQQMSELMHLPDIQIIGKMPPGTEIETVFSAGLCTSSQQPDNAQRVIDLFRGEDAAQAKRNQGMTPL